MMISILDFLDFLLSLTSFDLSYKILAQYLISNPRTASLKILKNVKKSTLKSIRKTHTNCRPCFRTKKNQKFKKLFFDFQSFSKIFYVDLG